ncbi:hypothetical protein QLH32_06470 [Acinetobacter corruptisaponis]|uniref:Uncharacterized protein n=1 Tax=Acinetobacter corruptisaponis TaxID=3045147 RepID=A0ABY8S5X5_9GAMM|nr:hypothetical protein [Acinetobacter sp. KCTC 92772]WHP07100.1 hypothetical protein QLH32_06470 [Acinetobacter sp. KCTC 92772]
MKIFCWMQALEKDKADIMTLYQNEKEVSLQKADTDLYIKLVYETKLHGKCEISQSNLKVYSLGNNFLLNINLGFKDNLGRNNPIVILVETEHNDAFDIEGLERVLYLFVHHNLDSGFSVDSIKNILNPVKKKSIFRWWITRKIRTIWKKIKAELQKLQSASR